MITYRKTRNGSEETLCFKSLKKAILHFLSTSKWGSSKEMDVVSITWETVTLQKDTLILDQEKTTYTGSAKEMATIVTYAAKLLCVKKMKESQIFLDSLQLLNS